MEKSRKPIIRAALVFACLLVVFLSLRALIGAAGDSQTNSAHKLTGNFSGNKLALVTISGPIFYSAKIIDILEKYGKDQSIKGIVLRIDSPGGGVSACQEIVAELKKVKKKDGYNKKVVVSFGTLAASGGYYIGCYGDRIFSNPGTLTGSIGVIMENLNLEELLNKVGVKEEVIKSGKFKDTGSSMRKMTTEERQLLQGVIDDVYAQFVDAVAEGRGAVFAAKIKKTGTPVSKDAVTKEQIVAEIKKHADGRIFSGSQAFQYGFVDELGTQEDAVNWAAKACGISGEPVVITPRKEMSLLERVFGDNSAEERFRGIFHGNGLSYMYGK